MSETKASNPKLQEQDLSWSDIYWSWKKRGYPPEEAAHQADEFMRRRQRERNKETLVVAPYREAPR